MRVERDKLIKYSNEYNLANYKVVEQSEKAGVQAAKDFIDELNTSQKTNFTIIHEGKGSGTLDLVAFDDASGKCIVIEAKGGNSALGTKKVGDLVAMQGTKPYLEDILKEMSNKAETEQIAEKVTNALEKEGRLEYILVHQKFNSAGDLLPTEIKQFNLSEN